MAVEQKTNIFAILSIVCAFLVPLLGIAFGIVALVQIQDSGEKGKGLAIAGIIISVVWPMLFFLFFLIGMFVFAGLAASSV